MFGRTQGAAVVVGVRLQEQDAVVQEALQQCFVRPTANLKLRTCYQVQDIEHRKEPCATVIVTVAPRLVGL
jgi:hypothetical protein